MKIITVFTEGVHDPAYLRWILKSLHFKEFDRKFSDLPEPIASHIKVRIKSELDYSIDANNISALSRPISLPRLIMLDESNETIIMIYISKGGTRTDVIKDIIENGIPARNENNDFSMPHSFGYIFFNDADSNYSSTLNKLQTEMKDYFIDDSDKIDGLESGQIIEISKGSISFYLFPEKNKIGALEDIVLPLMIKDNEPFFNPINNFIESNFPMIKENPTPKEKTSYEIKKKKAKIGTAGQLFKETAGMANYAIIMQKKINLISENKINEDRISQNIKQLFEDMIKNL